MRNIVAIIFLFYFSNCQSQTFTGVGGNVPDDAGFYHFDISVSGVSPAICDTTFGLETVCINAVHSYMADLNIYLIAPDGSQITLTTNNGGDQDGYLNTCFNQTSNIPINLGSYPFTGTYKPQTSLSAANNGQDPNGIWQILIQDTYPGADTGSLLNWTITFGNQPALPFQFLSSNLPILKIYTNGLEIPDEPKILATMQITDNSNGQRNHISDFPNYFNGRIGIEIRGASSQQFPKKSYGLAVWNINNADSNASILGMPSESSWVLHASYTDKSLMRNFMTYKMSNDLGHYAAKCRYVELLLNDEYQGVYVFMEKIKRGSQRVNVKKLQSNDNFGDNLTGGYIFKIDKWNGSGANGGWLSKIGPCDPFSTDTNQFQYDYPNGTTITPQQSAYIQSVMDSFELALMSSNFMDENLGYRKFIDLSSFIDATIINELSKNVDAYRISTYLHKNRNSLGGKIKLGPVWDYDIAWRNANYYGGDDPSGWQYENCGDGFQNPFWWKRFNQDSIWVNNFYCRWQQLRSTVLNYDTLSAQILARANFLSESQQRNFDYWPILGSYIWPNPNPIANSYSEEVQNMLWFIQQRLLWIDENIQGHCPADSGIFTSIKTHQNPDYLKGFTVFPIPSENNFTLNFEPGLFPFFNFEVFDGSGRLINKAQIQNNNQNIISFQFGTDLTKGLYLVKLKYKGFELGKRIVIKQ